MLEAFQRIWIFAGAEQKNIKSSMILAFFNAIFYSVQFGAVFVILQAVSQGSREMSAAWLSLALMLVSIAGRIVMQTFSQLGRVHAGYFMVADKRVDIGDKLRVVPMGFFSRNNLGQITAVTTTTLSDVENTAPVVLVTILGGFINSLVFAASVLLFDFRIGLIVLLGMGSFLLVASRQEKNSGISAPKRQRAQEYLVEKVLETVQGMSVVKSFNLNEKTGKRVDEAIRESCEKNMAIEKQLTPFTSLQQIVLNLFGILIILASIALYLSGKMPLVNTLMMLIMSFMVFEQMKSVGNNLPNLRITDASLEKTGEIDRVPVMDEGGVGISAGKSDVVFENVTFAYENRTVLQNVSFTVPEKTTTAIVGPSGSGKTTLCSLIARFWDVNGGSVRIGGRDVREYTLDSLMNNISMVFQNVYLFSDTVENNIKFGRPDASHEEVVKAARKACCHDLIMQLPQGYDTVLKEGGASLSGGEKQRISIARAILKNAPIIILDEATANVDPENEDRLQTAIEALMKDKTIIMIAHRLKTVKNADQILVLDGGKIVQRGNHAVLSNEKGIYTDFISRRRQEAGWKLKIK